MAISPMDIHHKEFSNVRMGGYNKEEVDSFLDMVADELDRLLHRNQEQAELVEAMRQKATQFDNMQTTLQNALINAQKSADGIVQEARSQAEAKFGEAQEQSKRILEEARSEKVRISQNFAGIRDQVFRYISTLRELLDKNQAMVKDYEERLAAAELKDKPIPSTAALSAEPEVTPSTPQISQFQAPDSVAAPETPLKETIPEPSPADYESGRGPILTEQAAPDVPEPAENAMSKEQEMEMMRESAEKPEEEPPSGEDKHFFWE